MGRMRRALAIAGLVGAAAALPLAPAGATGDSGATGDAGAATAVAQDECWSTPGEQWPVTCVSPDHTSQAFCLETKRFYNQAGYETSECIYSSSMAWGPWFFYHN